MVPLWSRASRTPRSQADEIALIEQYEGYSLEELYNLIGNLVAEHGDAATQEVFLGVPNVFDGAKKIVEDVRGAICSSQEIIRELAAKHRCTVEPILWAGSIADVILALGITPGIPPFAIAVVLGKFCNRTVAQLCDSEL